MRLLNLFMFLLALSTTSPALAQSADGVWKCNITGDIPIGLVTIAGNSYQFQSTNTVWEPTDDASNGSGSLDYDGSYLWPSSGPLKDDFEVTAFLKDGLLNWNNNSGLLMSCGQ
jgi:hypothetical protein